MQDIAACLQRRHVPGKGRRVTGDVDDAAGGEAGEGFNGVGIETLARGIDDHHVRPDALAFQLQSGLTCITAEKFRVFDAVSPGIVSGILHRLRDYLHTDDLPRGGSHGKGDGAHAAVQIQNRVRFCDLRLRDGGFIEPLGLMVVYLIEGAGGETEIQTAEGILNVARTMEGDKGVAQNGVALFGVDAQHQRGEAGDLLQLRHQRVGFGNAAAVDDQTHKNLPRNGATADVNMPQKSCVGGFVIDGHMVLIYIIHNNGLDPVGLLRQNQAAVVFHHIVGAGAEEACIGTVFLCGHRVLSLVAVAAAGGRGQNGHGFQLLAADAVQAVSHPFGLQTGFFFIIHVPEIAAAAELCNRAFPVHPVGGFFENFNDFPRCPGLAHQLNTNPAAFPGYRVGNEDSAALDVGDTLPLGGIVGDGGLVDLIFS